MFRYKTVPLRRTVGLKIVKGDFPTFERNYRMDTWKQRMKAFLYLVDVGPDEAPLQYLQGKPSWALEAADGGTHSALLSDGIKWIRRRK